METNQNNTPMESATEPCPCRLGYASVPMQKAKTIYQYGTALNYGTIFPSLNMPQGKYGPMESFRSRK
ncbi:MAG: spore coat associated protein CotJA [Clostridiales bacterium]